MYSHEFCKVYNEFGWNYFPEFFGEQLLIWIKENSADIKSVLDLGCGTGVLCEVLHNAGIFSQGADLSENMIEIARSRNADIHYDVANMITYEPGRTFDMITCTGDALNHIVDLKDVAKAFARAYANLNPGGYFIFDILNEKETGDGEPIELDYSETVKAIFQIRRCEDGFVRLSINVFENGIKSFEETITEVVHDKDIICSMLKEAGFENIKCRDHLLETQEAHGTTWFVIARKPL